MPQHAFSGVSNEHGRAGKHQAKRLFVTGAQALFAEWYRSSLEIVYRRPLNSFSELIVRALPYWERLDEEWKQGWVDRALIEKKVDHYIHLRGMRTTANGEIRTVDDEDDDEDDGEDPDELPATPRTASISTALPMNMQNVVASYRRSDQEGRRERYAHAQQH